MASKYLRRLQTDLPVWVERGWVSPEHRQAILDHAAAQEEGGPRYIVLALAVMGVVLLAAGIISFFAANWDAIPKLARLAVLFGGTWAAYAASGALTARGSTATGHAVLLLGVLLFGADIALVAQTYHIEAHFPNGILLWCLGALLAAWLMESQVVMVAAVLLGALWSGMEHSHFGEGVHWLFLPLWAFFLAPVLRHRWRAALHFALLTLMFWGWQTFLAVVDGRDRVLAALEPFLLVSLLLFFVARWQSWREERLAGTVQFYAAFNGLAYFFVLTFPAAYHGYAEKTYFTPPSLWVAGNLAVLGLVLLLAWRVFRRETLAGFPRRSLFGAAVLAGMAVLLTLNVIWILPQWFLPQWLLPHRGSWPAVLFNLEFFAVLAWLVHYGGEAGRRSLVNLAFAFFALGVLVRYFDTFWSLLDRSFFFMGGGVLLLAGGYWLERQRRKFTREILQRRKEDA